jgi:hypothetical protein
MVNNNNARRKSFSALTLLRITLENKQLIILFNDNKSNLTSSHKATFNKCIPSNSPPYSKAITFMASSLIAEFFFSKHENCSTLMTLMTIIFKLAIKYPRQFGAPKQTTETKKLSVVKSDA